MNLRDVLAASHFPTLATRKPAVVQVFWPSKKFADKDADRQRRGPAPTARSRRAS
jgi:hypothetical protein